MAIDNIHVLDATLFALQHQQLATWKICQSKDMLKCVKE